ncbi:MAG TPA: hypothetical protein DCP92_15355 [Nitrospiraceae bacterium]|nr:hypothetical protein [Nitrospiraceae bacterium]
MLTISPAVLPRGSSPWIIISSFWKKVFSAYEGWIEIRGRKKAKKVLRKTIALNLDILHREIMPDHVHLLVNAPPSFLPDQIMYRLKDYTSRRQTCAHLKIMPTTTCHSSSDESYGHSGISSVSCIDADVNNSAIPSPHTISL